MLATPGKLFSAPGWIHELKHDGFRCLTIKRGSTVRLESRSGRDMSERFPELVAEIAPIRADFVADGELVVLDIEGRSLWERLHGRHRLKDPKRIARAAIEQPAVIFAFDLLWLNGPDFRPRTLLQRKDALHRMLPANRRIRYATHIPDICAELWQLANAMDLEGIVAKRADSTYTAGRSNHWQKIKTDIGAERERQRRPGYSVVNNIRSGTGCQILTALDRPRSARSGYSVPATHPNAWACADCAAALPGVSFEKSTVEGLFVTGEGLSTREVRTTNHALINATAASSAVLA